MYIKFMQIFKIYEARLGFASHLALNVWFVFYTTWGQRKLSVQDLLTLVESEIFSWKPESCPIQPFSPHPLHVITCKGALTTGDVAGDTPELLVLDNFALKAYAWIGRSSNRRWKINNFLQFAQDPLAMRWSSRGQVMRWMGLQPRLETGSLIGQAYTSFDSECQ
jgi:hypothetical protein